MAVSSRRSICRLLIGVLVSTQWAIAAYACAGISRPVLLVQQPPAGTVMAMARADAPANPVGVDPAAGADADKGMSTGCSRLDPALPNLCVAYHQYGQQSADHSPAPAVSPALLIGLYTLPPPADGAARAAVASGSGDAPAAAVDPPHAVLHCCLRF